MPTPSPAYFRSLLLIGLSACATPPTPTETEATRELGTSTSRITGGRAADVDGPVVWIVAKIGGTTGYCSGVVVSPHVVLTAGHCAQADATFSIFLGNDYTDASAKARSDNYVAVAEHHAHPKYDAARNLHDVGVLVTEAPIPRTAAALNREPLRASDRGAPIRIVGFGQTSADDKTIGRRHEATTTIADYDGASLAINGTPSFCLFDSGGPTFMTRAGVEVVVGIHSIVESSTCDTTAWDVRVDVHADFVDAAIAKAEPPLLDAGEGAGGDAAGGTDPTANEPPTPTPPASAGSSCSVGGSPTSSSVTLSLVLAAAAFSRRSRRRSAPRR